jgi:hypothetical protein
MCAAVGEDTDEMFFLLPRNIENNYLTELDEDVHAAMFENNGDVKHLSKIRINDDIQMYLDPQYYYTEILNFIVILVEHQGFYRTVPAHHDITGNRYGLCRLWTSDMIPNNHEQAMFVKVYHNEVAELNYV